MIKPGEYYTTEQGDTLPKIAARAYGLSGKWPLILDVNQLEFKVSNQEEIQPGENIFIPEDPELIELQNIQNAL